MARAVTADHVLFKESIQYFRPRPDTAASLAPQREPDLFGHLLLDFDSTRELKLGEFTIKPTKRVDLPQGYAAFVAPVQLPRWIRERDNGHLFTIALSSVFSFAVGRPTKSPRDDYLIGKTLTDSDLLALAIQFPVLTAGPGAHGVLLSKATIEKYHAYVQDVVSALYEIPYSRYLDLIQGIRLVHLAHINKRDDFSLAYALMIAAIESVARIAVPRDDVKERHSSEGDWISRARSDPVFKELFAAYRKERGKNQYLAKSFVEFILRYCPINSWDGLEHPYSNIEQIRSELTGETPHNWLTEKKWFEVDLSEGKIRKMLHDAYSHRSGFIHRGQSPPHQQPVSSNRFFEEVFEYNESRRSVDRLIIPNFKLMAYIAQHSILNFARECTER